MGIFSKRESTHIKRDEEGKAVMTREEEPRGIAAVRETFRRPVDRQELTHEEQFPKNIQPAFVREKRAKQLISTGKKVDAWIGRNIQPIGGYPQRRTSARQSTGRKYSTKNNLNPFGPAFDRGVTPMRKPKQPNYAIVRGKAYPIAGKKKKKSKSRSKRAGSGYDMFDNWGF